MRFPDRHSDGCLWAYLKDPTSAACAHTLCDQKRVIEKLASDTMRRIERTIVDDDAETAAGASVVLQRTIQEARASLRRVTLLIAGTSCLGATPKSRRAALAALLTAGLVVEDPSGSLFPTLATVALARAAAERGTRRKLMAGRDADV